MFFIADVGRGGFARMTDIQTGERQRQPDVDALSDHLKFAPINRPAVVDRLSGRSDLVAGCVLLIIALPLLVLVALALKCEGSGPIFVRQECLGRGGRRFKLLRFRTRLHDPERLRPIWAEDITGLGRFLQYTRIEGLPQLINVLRGDISLR